MYRCSPVIASLSVGAEVNVVFPVFASRLVFAPSIWPDFLIPRTEGLTFFCTGSVGDAATATPRTDGLVISPPPMPPAPGVLVG